MAVKIAEIVETLEFVSDIDGVKDCLMAQQGEYWFNIDVSKGSGLKAGDKVRVIVERVD
ncbi:MAG: hypothetical protein M0P20_01330 [Methanocorpusculum sp.]|jgi:hypothetical protein|nr:hypothetical protein [Methanocorpusculum sp.]MDD2471077.1 hypothetical protein [Methanocorpusculum sp.]MDD3256733.1 hypothetical protein [Methanocorpusculum sp.]MDD4132268.1 hypothetical protein [Methanocorpusculum sp.]